MVLANVILPSFYPVPGLLAVVPGFVFVAISEAYIIARALGISFRKALRLSVRVNLVSGILGAGLFWLLPLRLGGSASQDLSTYFRTFAVAAALAYLVYFMFTLLLEWLSSLRWMKRNLPDAGKRRLLRVIGCANLVSYAVLVPVHYWYNTPSRHVRSVTDDTTWAASPPEDIVYLDAETRHLWTIGTDGSGKRRLVPHEMEHYLFSADLRNVVFFSDARELFHYDTQSEKLSCMWTSHIQTTGFVYDDLGALDTILRVGISPLGRRVAWTVLMRSGTTGAPGEWRLFVYDLSSGAIRTLDYRAANSRIAWSSQEDTLYVRCPACGPGGISGLVRLAIPEGGPIEIVGHVDQVNPAFADNYGWIGRWYRSGGKIRIRRHRDAIGALTATVPWPFVGRSSIEIKEDGNRVFSFSDTPFFAPLPPRQISNPAFVQDGKECLFEAREAIYLIDLNERRIGKVIDGVQFVVLTNLFHKKSFMMPGE